MWLGIRYRSWRCRQSRSNGWGVPSVEMRLDPALSAAATALAGKSQFIVVILEVLLFVDNMSLA